MAEPIDNSNKEINNGSTESNNENNNNIDEENKKKNKKVDPELFSCLLQPMTSDSGPHYIGIRRLLLFRKAHSGVHRRLAKKLGQFAKPPKHSGKQGNLLVDASVDDGFNLRVHSPICSRWTAGLPARTCEVSIHLLLAEQVLVQLQVIMILYVTEGLSLRILL